MTTLNMYQVLVSEYKIGGFKSLTKEIRRQFSQNLLEMFNYETLNLAATLLLAKKGFKQSKSISVESAFYNEKGEVMVIADFGEDYHDVFFLPLKDVIKVAMSLK